MNPSTQFNSFMTALGLAGLGSIRTSRSTLSRISAIVLLIGSIAPLQSQDSVKAQNAPETVPTAAAGSATKPEAATSAFNSYQRQTQLPTLSEYGFGLDTRSFINPFEAPANFSNLPGATGSVLDPERTKVIGLTRQEAIGFNPLGNFGVRPSQGDPGVLFQPLSVTDGTFGATPKPSLNQFMRGSFNLPLSSSSSSSFRFEYSSVLMPGGSLSDPARPYSSTLFTSSDLGNGVFLSAGTYNSGHSMAGASAMPQGNASGALKHSASGVAIKLSF